MRRRILAVETALYCFAIFLAGPAVLASGSADDDNSKGTAAGADLFGLTRVVNVQIEVPADEYEAMQPSPPAAFGGPPPAPRPKRPGLRPLSAAPGPLRTLPSPPRCVPAEVARLP